MEQHLTKAEVAKRLKVSPRTVQRWLGRKLPCVRLDKGVRIPESAINTFLAERTVTPASTP